MITADHETLLRQAATTVADYFSLAVQTLDERFGEGYAERNPALVGQLIAAMGEDFTTAVKAKGFAEALEHISTIASSFAG